MVKLFRLVATLFLGFGLVGVGAAKPTTRLQAKRKVASSVRSTRSCRTGETQGSEERRGPAGNEGRGGGTGAAGQGARAQWAVGVRDAADALGGALYGELVCGQPDAGRCDGGRGSGGAGGGDRGAREYEWDGACD